MDALSPAERVAFVLHDVFALPFDDIAVILGRSTPATKMLASRARARLRLGTPPATDVAAREVVDAFVAAAGGGDLDGLLAVLAPDVVLTTRGPDGPLVVRGASEVATRARFGAHEGGAARPVLVDDRPAVLVTRDGRPVRVMVFTVVAGQISAIRIVVAPDRLAQIVPSWVA
jgi:RNA polymerase sigma-70 factor (ECF subfamily)